jgi:diketogulonate reductase-like aldo/keto reductase
MAAIRPVGLGTWQATNPAELETALTYAIEEVGYRYLDTAHVYGNEAIIGAALEKIFAKGVIKRSDLFITTKLWLTNRRPDRVEPAIRESLAKLKLEYVDLYLIHWPVSYPPQADGNLFPKGPDGKALLEHIDILDTWAAFESLVEKGLTKYIGLSNFSIEMLERLQINPRVKIQPYAVQVEQSIYNQQLALIQYLEPRGIKLTSWSSFANGKVGPFGVSLLQDPVLAKVAQEVGKTPGQVALRYLLQLSPVVNVIPKSVTPARIKENFEVTSFVLNEDQVARIRARNVGFRINNGIEEFGYDVLALGL